jgi:hypothetical protein
MTDRRHFLRDTASVAGMVFTGCSLLDSRLCAQQSGVRQRRQVLAGVRRIRTIDFHAHAIVPEATALMGVKMRRIAISHPALFRSKTKSWPNSAESIRTGLSPSLQWRCSFPIWLPNNSRSA